MLGTLLESGSRGQRRRGETVASVIMHLAVIGAATVVTARPEEPPAPAAEERPRFFIPVPTEAPRGGESGTASGRSGGPPVVFVPGPVILDLPTPDIDGGPAAPSIDGTVAGPPLFGLAIAGVADPGSALPLADVDRAVIPLPSNRAPEYPAELRRAGIEGTVRVRFIVDTAGRVEPASLLIVAADEPRFVDAVRRAVPSMRFVPAEAQGRKVRMLVELPFVFRLQR